MVRFNRPVEFKVEATPVVNPARAFVVSACRLVVDMPLISAALRLATSALVSAAICVVVMAERAVVLIALTCAVVNLAAEREPKFTELIVASELIVAADMAPTWVEVKPATWVVDKLLSAEVGVILPNVAAVMPASAPVDIACKFVVVRLLRFAADNAPTWVELSAAICVDVKVFSAVEVMLVS